MNKNNKRHPAHQMFDVNSDEPIAALNGETPELILLEIGRNSIEAGNPQVTLRRLRQLTADRETVITGKGRLCLLIGGYDTDPRALPQIAAYGHYLRALINDWPDFGWFSALNKDFPEEVIQLLDVGQHPDSSFLNILLAGACTSVETPQGSHQTPREGWTPIEMDRERVAANVGCLFNGLLALGAQHTLPMDLVSQRIRAIEQLLEDRGII